MAAPGGMRVARDTTAMCNRLRRQEFPQILFQRSLRSGWHTHHVWTCYSNRFAPAYGINSKFFNFRNHKLMPTPLATSSPPTPPQPYIPCDPTSFCIPGTSLPCQAPLPSPHCAGCPLFFLNGLRPLTYHVLWAALPACSSQCGVAPSFLYAPAHSKSTCVGG